MILTASPRRGGSSTSLHGHVNFQFWVASPPLHVVDSISRHLQSASWEVELFQMRVSDTENLAERIVVALSDILSYRVVDEMALICTCKCHRLTVFSLVAWQWVALVYCGCSVAQVVSNRNVGLYRTLLILWRNWNRFQGLYLLAICGLISLSRELNYALSACTVIAILSMGFSWNTGVISAVWVPL
jgi:hypothetical protein